MTSALDNQRQLSSTLHHKVGSGLTDLLPELCDGAGQVGGVCQAVVGKAVLRVPVVITALPRKLLHTKQDEMQSFGKISEVELSI